MEYFSMRRWWHAPAAVAGLAIVATGFWLHDQDLTRNYIRIEGRASHFERHCLIVERGLLARPDQEIDCDLAYQVHESRYRRVHYRNTIAFEFISPLDHARYQGTMVQKNNRYLILKPGDSVLVYGHKTKPAKFEFGGAWSTARPQTDG